MSFNENDVNRDKGGKFDHKEGSAPDIILPLDGLSGHTSTDVQKDFLDEIQGLGPIAASKMQPVFGANDEVTDRDRQFADAVQNGRVFSVPAGPVDVSDGEYHFPLPDIDDFDPHASLRTPHPPYVEPPAGYVPAIKADAPLPDLDGYDPHARQNIQQVIETLNSGHIADSGVTSDDLGKLREAIERAEYNLVDNEIKEYLAANHPEVKGILIESDGYDSPSIVGLEIEDGSEPVDGRNYGTVIQFDERYGDLYAHLYNYSEDIARFQDRGSFDEFATVLTDDNEQFGRFQGLYGDMATDTPTYRIAARD